MEKAKKEKRQKPKYGMLSCIGHMMGIALKNEPLVVWGGLLIAILAVVQNLVNLFISPMVLRAVEQKVSASQLILTILLMIAILVLAKGVSTYVGGVRNYAHSSFIDILFAGIENKCATTSYSNFESADFNQMKGRVQQGMGSMEGFRYTIPTLFGLLQNCAGFVIYLLMLTHVEPVLLLIMLATTIPGYYLHRYLDSWERQHVDEKVIEARRDQECVIFGAGISAAKDMRIFGMEGWMKSIFHSAHKVIRDFAGHKSTVLLWGDIADLLLTFLRNGVAYFYLIRMVLGGGLAASEFLLYFSAVGGFTGWVTGILSSFARLYNQCCEYSLVREFINYPEPFKFEEGDPVPGDKNLPCEIRLENVSFRYPGAENDTLKHIDLTLKAGERLAVVGLNGAGKTTLVKIISGLYDPTEGRVTYNGVDIRTLNRREYYTRFTAIFQDLTVLPGSLATNIAVSETDIDMEKVRRCAAQAGLAKKFASLPDGYETHLDRSVFEDAVDLSGGEHQRLILARALYKDAPILLLDEPTAALDPLAESDIYQKYGEMTAGKSSVYISHRLASTRFCDRIILIADNVIAEEGTHAELLRKGGRYAELFEVQSRYYKEDFKPDGKTEEGEV